MFCMLACAQVLLYPSESTTSPMMVPIDAIHLAKPDADWPPHIDFMQTLAGVLSIGLDLQREPIDVKFPISLCGRPISTQGLQIKKGFKRISAALYVLMQCLEFDPEDPALDVVKTVLVNLRLIPCAYKHHTTEHGHTFDYIMLSNRQALRQRLSPLQLSFIMETMIASQLASDSLSLKGSKKDKLFSVVEIYNKQAGVRDVRAWQITNDERWSLCNICIGLSETSKTILRVHLNTFKWSDCALTRDHCRSTQWMLGNSIGSGHWKELLLITPASQELFLDRYLTVFTKSATKANQKKQKSGRPGGRISVEEFNMQASICALYLSMETAFKVTSAMECSKKDAFLGERRRMFYDGHPPPDISKTYSSRVSNQAQ